MQCRTRYDGKCSIQRGSEDKCSVKRVDGKCSVNE